MKENMLDVLMYLLETYIDADIEAEPDRIFLRGELEQAGFNHSTIDSALDWLDGLVTDEPGALSDAPTDQSMRFYNRRELGRLGPDCRGFLMQLENSGILKPAQREIVLDRCLALDCDEIDLEQIKWVALMVLFNQPDQELNVVQLEELVIDNKVMTLH